MLPLFSHVACASIPSSNDPNSSQSKLSINRDTPSVNCVSKSGFLNREIWSSNKMGSLTVTLCGHFSLSQRKHTRPQNADVPLDLCNTVYRLDLQNIG